MAVPSVGFSGHFTVELRDSATGLIKQHLSFKNVITSAGLNAAYLNGGPTIGVLFSHLAVGTNSTAPAIGDLALGAQVGPRSAFNGGVDSALVSSAVSPGYFGRRVTREFGGADANGNLTEIGMFQDASGGTMWCRALFRDAANAPVTVVKTSADVLRVTYEIRIYLPAGDAVNAVTISGTPYSITWRPVGQIDVNNTFAWVDNVFASSQGGSEIAAARLSTQTVLQSRNAVVDVATSILSTSGTTSFNTATLVQSYSRTWEPSDGANAGASLIVGVMRQGTGVLCAMHGVVTPAFNKTALQRLVLNYTVQVSRVVI